MDKKIPLPEHPNPQFERKEYMSLNGEWEFCVNKNRNIPSEFNSTIIVPYAVETELSGIGMKVEKDDFLHYRKIVILPKEFQDKRLMLHFLAVDQICDVYIDGILRSHHEGGYLPFQIDLGDLKETSFIVDVLVSDDTSSPIYPRGKQSSDPHGIWYTPTSGIWGSVYIEALPEESIRSVDYLPDFFSKKINIDIDFEGEISSSALSITCPDGIVLNLSPDFFPIEIDLADHFFPWSPEHPYLYKVELQINGDKIFSYFGMREFGCIDFNGHKVFSLNGKPYFLKGVLDQGYYPGGDLTPSSFEVMRNDISLMKSMGFNLLRKHIKIEMPYFYYLCDSIGIIVSQDFVNFGSQYSTFLLYTALFVPYKFNDVKPRKLLGASSEEGKKIFEDNGRQIIKHLRNVVSLAIWTVFNEGWGQFEAVRMSSVFMPLDSTRLFDITSGWYDKKVGYFNSKHVYFKKIRFKNDKKRILALTECGGYVFDVTSGQKETFGYGSVKTKSDFLARVASLYENQLIPCKEKQGLSVLVYTQLSDVETELNGLVSFDRKTIKIEPTALKRLNDKLMFEEK